MLIDHKEWSKFCLSVQNQRHAKPLENDCFHVIFRMRPKKEMNFRSIQQLKKNRLASLSSKPLKVWKNSYFRWQFGFIAALSDLSWYFQRSQWIYIDIFILFLFLWYFSTLCNKTWKRTKFFRWVNKAKIYFFLFLDASPKSHITHSNEFVLLFFTF